jgi:phage terminase large subunit-like protein
MERPNRPSVETIRRYAADPMEFFEDVAIPGADGPVRFGDAMAEFQREVFAEIAPCLLAVAAGRRPPRRGFWIERTKGGSKDSDIGLCLVWLLLFSPRPLTMEAGADDQDQSKEMYLAMQDLQRLNPWIGDRLTFYKNQVLCKRTGSTLDFLTTDATGAHGSRPAVTVCNELSHVGNRDFISTMMDNASKIPGNLTIIATNAGFLKSWQHVWRQKYRHNPRWFFQKVARPAPWISADDVEEAKSRNTASRFNRLWWGVWTGEGDALDPADVDACCTLGGPGEWQPGWIYASGLDLGVKNDHAALVVLGAEAGSGRVALADCQSWAPGPSGQVDLVAVREAQLDAHRRFGLFWCGFDPSQALLMAQELALEGLPMQEVTFGGKNLDTMARDLLSTFRNRRIDLYPDDLLIEDLHRLTIVERRYGYKLEAVSDERGHADRATALAIVLPMMLLESQVPALPEEDGDVEYRVIA